MPVYWYKIIMNKLAIFEPYTSSHTYSYASFPCFYIILLVNTSVILLVMHLTWMMMDLYVQVF